MVILDGQRVVIGNVGDSSALLCGYGGASLLRPLAEWESGEGGGSAKADGTEEKSPDASQDDDMDGGGASKPDAEAGDKASSAKGESQPHTLEKDHVSADQFLELSADHSPESPEEFDRIRQQWPCPHR